MARMAEDTQDQTKLQHRDKNDNFTHCQTLSQVKHEDRRFLQNVGNNVPTTVVPPRRP